MVEIGPKLADTALKAIGGVADGLVDLIATGQANFKKFAAEILKDLAKIMMRAALANIVASAFGIKLPGSAKGNVVERGRMKPYAQGGLVTGPTVFPMANGDVGLMGEAGPEAIMPLKRGPSGRLGVEVTNQGSARDAMNRYSRRGTTASSMAMGVEAQGMDAPAGGPVAIDVRYNVERINSVDYVTADEFQRGMRQAADQGATQGELRALSTLRQNTSQRRRIGL